MSDHDAVLTSTIQVASKSKLNRQLGQCQQVGGHFISGHLRRAAVSSRETAEPSGRCWSHSRGKYRQKPDGRHFLPDQEGGHQPTSGFIWSVKFSTHRLDSSERHQAALVRR